MSQKICTPGKFRGLQQCATARGAISVLALDHRNNMRRALNPQAPDTVSDADLMAAKQAITRWLGPAATAVLLDPELGAAQAIAASALPGAVGLLVAIEATGYAGDAAARESRILPGWSVAQARRMGANAIKLLVYYHPDAPTAPAIEALVQQVGQECAHYDIPFFLEPLSYPLDPAAKHLTGVEYRRVVVETARRLTPLGVDVLKAEFPCDSAAQPDERDWVAACAELSAASVTPWVLLSAGVSYETYLRQVAAACSGGASGVAVGRAVWKEFTSLQGAARVDFLRGLAYERMVRVTALCEALARPWTEFYALPDFSGDWYLSYPGFNL